MIDWFDLELLRGLLGKSLDFLSGNLLDTRIVVDKKKPEEFSSNFKLVSSDTSLLICSE